MKAIGKIKKKKQQQIMIKGKKGKSTALRMGRGEGAGMEGKVWILCQTPECVVMIWGWGRGSQEKGLTSSMPDSRNTQGSMPGGSHCPPQETGHWRLKKPTPGGGKLIKT